MSDLTIVIKVGSSSISSSTRSSSTNINICFLAKLVECIHTLMSVHHHRVILVSSGAVSTGCLRLGLNQRPSDVIVKQAVAAVGQCRLMRLYDDLFSHVNQPIAQVLLSRENISKSHHYENILNTFEQLFKMNIVPIVNENDTVAIEELRVGDNDMLSAMVASLIDADLLLLLTDVDAFYTADPHTNSSAKPIRLVENIETFAQITSSDNNNNSNKWGTGGIASKLQAARLASLVGVTTGILSSSKLDDIFTFISQFQNNLDNQVGTRFLPNKQPILCHDKKRICCLKPVGSVCVYQSSIQNLLSSSVSLLSSDVYQIHGQFPAHSCISIVYQQQQQDQEPIQLALGIVDYSSNDIENMMIATNTNNAIVRFGNLVVIVRHLDFSLN
jgi:glutamate 5-kinase